MKIISNENYRLPQILDVRNGQEQIIYTLPSTQNIERDSALIFSLHKSGTVLLSCIIYELAENIGLKYIDITSVFFNRGMFKNEYPSSTSNIFLERGYCYGGFTYIPDQFKITIFDQVKSILLVRDPRDMLVSLYFSMRYSHPEPGKNANGEEVEMIGRRYAQEKEIDLFVLDVMTWYQSQFSRYQQALKNENMHLFRYEDVVYDKEKWVKDICEHFDWDIPINIQRQIGAKNNIIPSHEDKMKHIRQVHPGNYKKKLKVETIRKLEETFAEEMAFFGYEPYKE